MSDNAMELHELAARVKQTKRNLAITWREMAARIGVPSVQLDNLVHARAAKEEVRQKVIAWLEKTNEA